MNKKEYACDLILDLLPNMLDDLCSVETEEIVLSHLETCESCKKTYSEMSADLKLNMKLKKSEKKKKPLFCFLFSSRS